MQRCGLIRRMRLHRPARQRTIRLRRPIRDRARRRPGTRFLDGRHSPPGGRGEEWRLRPGEEPGSRRSGNREHHDGGGGRRGHASPVQGVGRPAPLRPVECSTAHHVPAGARWSAPLHSLAERTAQLRDQRAVDAHLPPTVRAGLQVGQMGPGARPELLAEREVFQQLSTRAATAHGATPLPWPARAAPPGAAIAAP